MTSKLLIRTKATFLPPEQLSSYLECCDLNIYNNKNHLVGGLTFLLEENPSERKLESNSVAFQERCSCSLPILFMYGSVYYSLIILACSNNTRKRCIMCCEMAPCCVMTWLTLTLVLMSDKMATNNQSDLGYMAKVVCQAVNPFGLGVTQ